jgi:hypothetical protein
MKSVFSVALAICVLVIAAVLILGTSNAVAQPTGVHTSGAIISVAAQDNTAAPDLTGSWVISWTANSGDQRQASVQITQKGNKLSGTFQGPRRSVPLKGTLDGDQVTLTVKLRRRQLSFTGTVNGDKMSGTTENGVAWSAARQ